MDHVEERLAEEVRKYDHLYNPSLTAYKDAQMGCNSWKEISANVGLQVDDCTKLWRRIRDKFVCQRKTLRSSSAVAMQGARKSLPFIYTYRGWEKVNKQSTTTATPIRKASLRSSSRKNITPPSLLAGNCFATRTTLGEP